MSSKRRFSASSLLLVVVGAIVALALAPMAVESAGRVVRIAGKGNRVPVVSKSGSLSVKVTNQPKVQQVSGDVAVRATEPLPVRPTQGMDVRVPEGVRVTNQPEPPTQMEVHSATGRLKADVRPQIEGAWRFKEFFNSTGFHVVQEFSGDERGALSEITFSTLGGSGAWDMALVAYVHTSGTAACGGVGWTKTSLRDLSVPAGGQTLQLDFDAVPMVLPHEPGRRTCFGIEAWSNPSSSVVRIGGTGYRF